MVSVLAVCGLLYSATHPTGQSHWYRFTQGEQAALGPLKERLERSGRGCEEYVFVESDLPHINDTVNAYLAGFRPLRVISGEGPAPNITEEFRAGFRETFTPDDWRRLKERQAAEAGVCLSAAAERALREL